MKKAIFFLLYTIACILWLYGSLYLWAWLFYSTVLAYVLLSLAAFVLPFVILVYLLKKNNYFSVKTKKRMILIGIFSFFIYIVPMYLVWGQYDWHFYVDNSTKKEVEFIINDKVYPIAANHQTHYEFDAIKIHSPTVSINYKGKIYHFENPGQYVFNVDALNSYYIVRHEVCYQQPILQDLNYSFSLTDSIVDTIYGQMFFNIPCRIDKWFAYPNEINVQVTKNKDGEEIRRDEPQQIYSIQRIPEYEQSIISSNM